MVPLPVDRMPEAEVALRLALHLLALPGSLRRALVAIDGAQVEVHNAEVFPIARFLEAEGWELSQRKGKNAWQGTYVKGDAHLDVRAESGLGDVVCKVGGITVRADARRARSPRRKEVRSTCFCVKRSGNCSR
jgi:hypothetical protein